MSDGKDEAFRKRWEQKGYDDVQNALPNGDLLIAFDPYQPNVELKVAAEAKAMARRWRRLFPKRRRQSHGRLRPGSWLPVIEDFEYEELTRGPHTKRNDQLFARYRRIIGAWRI